jgi:hypothetical protein
LDEADLAEDRRLENWENMVRPQDGCRNREYVRSGDVRLLMSAPSVRLLLVPLNAKTRGSRSANLGVCEMLKMDKLFADWISSKFPTLYVVDL